jgi:hypothetical protein
MMFFKWLESNFNGVFSGMSPQDRWGGPNADLTKRLVAADAHDDEHNNQEISDRLRNPKAHLALGDNGHLRHSIFTYEYFQSAFLKLRSYIQDHYGINMFLSGFWVHDAEELKSDPKDEKSLPYGQCVVEFRYQNMYDYDQSPPVVTATLPANKKDFNYRTTWDKVGEVVANIVLADTVEQLNADGRDLDSNDTQLSQLSKQLIESPYEKESPMERLANFVKKRNQEKASKGLPPIKLKNTRFDAPPEQK